MTFADLYHLDKKCRSIEEEIEKNKPSVDTNNIVDLELTVARYEDIKVILRDCKALIYDLCQVDVRDVINRDS